MSQVQGTLTWALDTLEEYEQVLTAVLANEQAVIDSSDEEERNLTVTFTLEI